MSDAILSEEWRRSLSLGWQRILPLLRNRIEELQRRLDEEHDATARLALGAEIALRRINLKKAESAASEVTDNVA